MSYPGEEDHRDYRIDSDIAEDNLDRIIRLKEQLVELMDKMVAAGGDMKDAFAMEDAFDDSLHDEWRKNYEAPVAITYSSAIPSCDDIRRRMIKNIRPAPTNPATREGFMKLCRDCKWCKTKAWYDPSGWPNRYEFSVCENPKIAPRTKEDIVSGKKTIFVKYCQILRGSFGECQPEAKYFERKSL